MISSNDFVFNGNNISEIVIVEEIRRHVLPPIRTRSIEVDGYAGEQFLRNDIGASEIEVDCRLIEQTRMDITETKRKFAGMLYTRQPAKLQLRDEPTRYDMAIIDGATAFERLFQTGFATLVFRCPEAASFSAWEMTTSIMGTQSIAVGGTWETRPNIVVKGVTGSELTVTNNTTGEFMRIIAQLAPSALIAFDCIRRDVSLNSTTIKKHLTLDSDYIRLLPGNNTLNISAGTAELRYRERWL